LLFIKKSSTHVLGVLASIIIKIMTDSKMGQGPLIGSLDTAATADFLRFPTRRAAFMIATPKVQDVFFCL
jgi:hypothetical protein